MNKGTNSMKKWGQEKHDTNSMKQYKIKAMKP